jgi:hypothetical protein
MRIITSTLLAASLAPFGIAHALTPTEAAGHWEGGIEAPSGTVEVSLDLAVGADGKLGGTFTNERSQLTGLPLWSVTLDGSALRAELKAGGDGVQTFAGKIGGDGKTLTGDFLISVYAVPFTLTRTGAAKIEPPPVSPAIDSKLTGEWRGALEIKGQSFPVVIALANHRDGTATGSWSTAGGVAIPITIENSGRGLKIASHVAPAVYTAELSADGGTLSGTFTEGPVHQVLALARGTNSK